MSDETNDFVETLNRIGSHGMDDEEYSNLIASLEIRSDPYTHMLIAYVQRLRTQTDSNMRTLDTIASGMLTKNESQEEAQVEVEHWSVRKWR